jgi:cytochrome c-type biogenesis protein CcmH/NrfF/cytochrome c-type biogenesis protein CcmH/NrfG
MRFFIFRSLFAGCLLLRAALHAASSTDIDDRTREIATELRCVVCQNLSVADSPSEMAQQMRAIVREQVAAGRTSEEIKEFFVSKYGEWVLLKPKSTGFSALLWILPYVALLVGVVAALLFVRRIAARKKLLQESSSALPDPQSHTLLRRDNARLPDIEDSTPRAELLRERAHLRAELLELDFDYQSGKLSPSDHQALTQAVETKGAMVLQQLVALPSPAEAAQKKATATAPVEPPKRLRRWQLIGGAAFLLIFGITLGVLLTQSIRPRGGANDTMTGDFMTGTTPPNSAAAGALAEGRQAFSRQDFPKAIEAFKQVLVADPDNAEAHSYMGFILLQAGHGDGALLAFDKALSRAPNFPMALWGKGMTLYHDKKDFAGARTIFEQLLNLVPPGAERNEIAKVLAEIPTSSDAPKAPLSTAPAGAPAGPSISGKVTVDTKLKSQIDPQATLFIIARSGTGGPPLAVKKIDKPAFPLDYTLGQENVMMQGTPFAGKINLSVRLDKDGNPTTRGAGDMTGEYKKNPVEVGTKNADIVIDQVTQ